MSLPIERLFSIHSPTAEDDLVAVCRELRSKLGLPHRFLPLAHIQGGDSYLLVDCNPETTGRLYHWSMAEAGFRWNDPDFDNVKCLSYGVRDIPAKFGPLRNREDMDGLFAQLHAKAGSPQGAKTAEQVVAAGYDINFVLPGCQHPVFSAMDAMAFGVAQKMIELGTRADHADRENNTVSDRLLASLQWWQNRLAESDLSDNIHQVAQRRIAAIEASLAVYAQTPRKTS